MPKAASTLSPLGGEMPKATSILSPLRGEMPKATSILSPLRGEMPKAEGGLGRSSLSSDLIRSDMKEPPSVTS